MADLNQGRCASNYALGAIMIPAIRLLTLAALLVALPACTPQVQRKGPYTDEQRIQINEAAHREEMQNPSGSYRVRAIKVAVPRGEGWRIISRDFDNLYFGRKISDGHTRVASVEIRVDPSIPTTDIEAFRKDIINVVNVTQSRTGAVQNQKHELDDHLATFCVRSEVDNAVGALPQARESWVILSCLDPEQPTHLYRIAFSERSRAAIDRIALETSASQFFEGVGFLSRLIPND